MATERQKKAVNNLVGNGGNVTKAMRDAKYSENTLNTPKKLTESKGYQELCEQCGLTDELLLNSLTEDIKAKKKNRKPELELGFKIKGRLTEKVDLTSKGKAIFTQNQIDAILNRRTKKDMPSGEIQSD